MATIQISEATVISKIKRHLSAIGKRLYNKEGKNMFSDITLSSAETELLSQYIQTSAHDIEGVLKQFINASTIASTITFEIENTRGDTDFAARVTDMVSMYLILSSAGEYLAMTHPDIAQKYQRDAQQRIESLVSFVFYKQPPTATADITAATAKVS